MADKGPNPPSPRPYKVAKHFELIIEDARFDFTIRKEEVAAEAALDGIYVIRSSLAKCEMSAPEAVRSYKAHGLPCSGRSSRSTSSPAHGAPAECSSSPSSRRVRWRSASPPGGSVTECPISDPDLQVEVPTRTRSPGSGALHRRSRGRRAGGGALPACSARRSRPGSGRRTRAPLRPRRACRRLALRRDV